jgi:hypothetical protein
MPDIGGEGIPLRNPKMLQQSPNDERDVSRFRATQ